MEPLGLGVSCGDFSFLRGWHVEEVGGSREGFGGWEKRETNAFIIATTLKETEVENPCCSAYVGRRPMAPTSTNSKTG